MLALMADGLTGGTLSYRALVGFAIWGGFVVHWGPLNRHRRLNDYWPAGNMVNVPPFFRFYSDHARDSSCL